MNLEARKIAISTPCNLLWNHDNSLSPALINGPYFIFQLASNLNNVFNYAIIITLQRGLGLSYN